MDEIFRDIDLLTSGQEFGSVLGMMKHCRRLRFNFGHSVFLLATIMSSGTF